MNKRRNKLSIYDIADNISAMAYDPIVDSVFFYNAEADDYESGELADELDSSIVYYCKEIVKEIMPLL